MFDSPEELSAAFYKVQDYLSYEYGQMSEPILHEITPPIAGKWENQDFLESESKMGRVYLIHKIAIKNNAAGEQILMFLE